MARCRARAAVHLLVVLSLAGLGSVAGAGCGSNPQEPEPPGGDGAAGRGRDPSWLVFRGAGTSRLQGHTTPPRSAVPQAYCLTASTLTVIWTTSPTAPGSLSMP